jgi:hypothetical protein
MDKLVLIVVFQLVLEHLVKVLEVGIMVEFLLVVVVVVQAQLVPLDQQELVELA